MARMGSETSRTDHFCNNLKAYYKKRGEEQFYDFTIKDKDGAEVRSHKFILASQSEYFAALFRIDPTASETTFKDFSIDVIKECIEYLYVHEVNLTGDNVQDVLMFADYITLTDVIAICTDYIIKNIDRSNYAHVINLGNSRGMYNMVEAGVSFAIRNLACSRLSVNGASARDKSVRARRNGKRGGTFGSPRSCSPDFFARGRPIDQEPGTGYENPRTRYR
ncbi:kelch-like protein 40a [Oculina patagonica]